MTSQVLRKRGFVSNTGARALRVRGRAHGEPFPLRSRCVVGRGKGNSDMKSMTMVDRLRRQQAALAEFGTFAFSERDLHTILTEAARVCAECLCEPFAKICRFRKDENDLLVVAGCGWKPGVIGNVVSQADESSTQGRAFITGEPVI